MFFVEYITKYESPTSFGPFQKKEPAERAFTRMVSDCRAMPAGEVFRVNLLEDGKVIKTEDLLPKEEQAALKQIPPLSDAFRRALSSPNSVMRKS